jgi:hypothetical protein
MNIDGLGSLDDMRFLVFTDMARLWVQDALPGTQSMYDLLSTGTGFRMLAFKHLVSEFYWEYPFVATEFVKVGQQRIDFRVAYEF